MYIKTGIIHHTRKAIAERAAACVAHVHGTGGICRNKFNVDALSFAVIAAPVILSGCAHVKQHIGIIGRAEIKIDKAGTCDFHTGKIRIRKVHVRRERFRDLARRKMQRARVDHGGVGGIIAVGFVCRNFNVERAELACRKASVGLCFLRGRRDESADLFFCFLNRKRHCVPPLKRGFNVILNSTSPSGTMSASVQ